jgi:hypothetical protein
MPLVDLAVPDQFSNVGQGWDASHGLLREARSRFFDKFERCGVSAP